MDKKNFVLNQRSYKIVKGKRKYLEYYEAYKNTLVCRRRRVFSPFTGCETLEDMHQVALAYLATNEPKKRNRNILFKYFELNSNRIKPKTISSFTSILDRYILWCNEVGAKPHKIKPDQLQQYQDAIVSTKSETTALNNINSLKIIFNNLAKRGIIKPIDFSNLTKLKYRPQSLDYFNKQQIEIIKKFCLDHDPQLWVAILLLYACFIRPGEMRELKVYDIDIQNGVIYLKKHLTKNRKSQRVAIPGFIKKDLWQYLDSSQANQFVFSENGRPGTKILPRDNLSRRHKKVLKATEIIGNYAFYSWKHTGAVNAVKAGINIKALQNQLRHHSLDMVNEYLKNLGVLDSPEIVNKFPKI